MDVSDWPGLGTTPVTVTCPRCEHEEVFKLRVDHASHPEYDIHVEFVEKRGWYRILPPGGPAHLCPSCHTMGKP